MIVSSSTERRASVALVLTLFLFTQSACGGTARFIAAPSVELKDKEATVVSAVEELFMNSLPYTISMCEADLQTGLCVDKNVYPSASGLGGLFLPLFLELESIRVVDIKQQKDGLKITTQLHAPVNTLPSICGDVSGKIKSTRTTASLEFISSYCNWMVIGNVIQTITLSIDSINIGRSSSFTGYYKISFFGTGNASGSGYYRAEILQ